MCDDEPFPIKLGPVSNGEFLPVPHTPFVREVIRRTRLLADEHARRLGVSRREFLTGVTGAATALFVLSACSNDEAKSKGRRPGGSFDVSTTSTIDRDSALGQLGGAELLGTGEPLARVLEKIESAAKQVPMNIDPAQATAYIINPLTGRKVSFAGLFQTHPPTAERIARLRHLS